MTGADRYFRRPGPFPDPARPRPQARHHVVATPVLVGGLLAAGVLAAVLKLFAHGPVQVSDAIAFGAVIAVGEALRITLPGGRDNAPLAATASLGYALTTMIGGKPALWGPVQVVVVVAVAAVIGSIPQAIAGRPASIGYLVRRIGVTAMIAWLLRSALASTIVSATHTERFLLLSAMAILALLIDPALAAVFATSSGYYANGSLIGHSEYGDSSYGQVRPPQHAAVPRSVKRLLGRWFEECAATARVCPAVAALSVATALAADPLGLWVLPVAAVPVLVMQRALRRYSAIRATYQQTIRALSRMTDLAGYTDPGHARRVCRLALAIGRDLDLTEPELLDLEYAALLHDIGQLSLADPLPGGATVLATPWVAAEVAARGAEVIRQTGVLDRVARVLEAQPLSYRAQLAVSEAEVGEDEAVGDESERRAAAILRVANDFEDLRTAEPGPSAHVRALSRIRRGIGDPYDPRAVESLSRLVPAE